MEVEISTKTLDVSNILRITLRDIILDLLTLSAAMFSECIAMSSIGINVLELSHKCVQPFSTFPVSANYQLMSYRLRSEHLPITIS